MLTNILQKPVVAFEMSSSYEEPTLEGTGRLSSYRAEHEKSKHYILSYICENIHIHKLVANTDTKLCYTVRN